LTYNGSTNNISRRLRQHNGEITGGAKATKGHKWEIYALVSGFKCHRETLSFEWKIKHPTKTKRRPAKYCGVNGRILGLNLVINQNCNQHDYNLYLTNDVLDLIDINNIPSCVNVYKVKKMGNKFMNLITEPK
jgi:predicted GIY-YIG superfamily endonuclease